MTRQTLMIFSFCLMNLLTGVVSADLGDGLEAYYPFDGNANDASGNGWHGSLAPPGSGPILTEDVLGNADSAYELDGVEDRITLSGFGFGTLGNTFSISLWVNPHSIDDGQCFASQNKLDYENLFFFGFRNGGIYVGINGETHAEGEKFTGWHHLVVVVEDTGTATASNVKLYRDGVLEWEQELAAVIGSQSAMAMKLGMQWGTMGFSDFLDGVLDEVRFYSRTLTPYEVQSLRDFGWTMPPSLEPRTAPDSLASRMYSIEDLYNYLETGVRTTRDLGGFNEPSTGPQSTGRTLDEVHAIIEEHCITCKGTIWDDPVTPEPETRWCDNGDGTITDLTTGLFWLKNAGWGGAHPFWASSANLVNAHDRAAQLQDGLAGLTDGSAAGDWRLPTISELLDLVTGDEPVGAIAPRAFSGVQAFSYWSSSTNNSDPATAWTVHLLLGTNSALVKTLPNFVWPVRSPQ